MSRDAWALRVASGPQLLAVPVAENQSACSAKLRDLPAKSPEMASGTVGILAALRVHRSGTYDCFCSQCYASGARVSSRRRFEECE
jgi:hypothetical protein